MPALINTDGPHDTLSLRKPSLDSPRKFSSSSPPPTGPRDVLTDGRGESRSPVNRDISYSQTNGDANSHRGHEERPAPRSSTDLPLRQLANGTKYLPNGNSTESLSRWRTSEDQSDAGRSTANGISRSSGGPVPLNRIQSNDSQSSATFTASAKAHPALNLTNSNALTPVEESFTLTPRVSAVRHDDMLKVPDKSQAQRPSTPPTASGIVPPSPAQSRHPPGRRRGSNQLARRVTRSLASDLHLDEVPADDDAARWAERIKQRRISTRRKRDDDEERVVMGTKLDESHVNYVTAYNMLTGIRFCVSRTNAKMDRELTDADFVAQHKFAFDVTGNELTPSSRYDFKFKDYAPWVFRHLRRKFRIDPADYLMSLTDKYILSELGSPGKSGSFFYFSRDYKYIIKTVHHSEAKFLRKVLHEYYDHVQANPNTLLSEFYGLHRVKMPFGRKIHFVVMNNLFPPHKDIHRTFDLKGSTLGREYREDQLATNPRATLKDLNWINRNMHLEFGPVKSRAFIEQMQRDVALLRRLQIMDYSLLVGVHDLGRGNRENLRDKTLQVFEPGGERTGGTTEGWTGSTVLPTSGSDSLVISSAPPYQLTHVTNVRDSTLSRTPSKVGEGAARNAKELRQLVRDERPVPMDQTDSRLPETMLEEREGYFYADEGGIAATHGDDGRGEEIYYLGIIDCLTKYGMIKKLEHFFKGLSAPDQDQISAVSPERYGERFVEFLKSQVKTREQAGSMML